MPSTYTNDLRLELQANGENSSTWGTKLNSTIQQIEDAIAGMVSVAVTGGTTTLTTVNGGTDEARYAILKIAGPLVSNSIIVVPAVSKSYIVWNATSGAYTVIVKTAAGTGIYVPQGGASMLFCDGTDVLSADRGVVDSTFRIADQADPTKLLAFELGGFTTGNTRTLTPPDASTTIAGLGVAQTFTAAQAINVASAATNAVTNLLTVTSQSTGTPAAGIGVGVALAAETAAGNVETGAVIEAVTTDVTAASEDFDIVFKTMKAGAAATESLRVKTAALNVPTGFTYQINGTDVLSSTTLGTGVVNATLTTINAAATSTAGALWNTTMTTGSISMGGALTTGTVNIANGTAVTTGTVNIASGNSARSTGTIFNIGNGVGTIAASGTLTANILSGATTVAGGGSGTATRSLNIGVNGGLNVTTNVNIGSTNLGTTTVNSPSLAIAATAITSTNNPSLNIGTGALTAGSGTFSSSVSVGNASPIYWGGQGSDTYVNGSSASDVVEIVTTGVQRGLFSSTGLSVTGSGTFSGGASGGLKIGVDNLYMQMQGGTASATSATLILTGPSYAAASTAYIDATNTKFRTLNGAAEIATFSSTGLSVTGNISTTKASGDTSVTAYATSAGGGSSFVASAGDGVSGSKYAYARFFNNDATAIDWRVGTYANNNLSFVNATSGSTLMVLDTSGNLLVGGTSNTLSARGIIEGTSGYTLGLRHTGIVTWYLNAKSDAALGFNKDGSELMTLDGSGNLIVPAAYSVTTASAANCFVETTGQFKRSTSALKYKQDIRSLEQMPIDGLQAVRYKSKCDGDDQEKDHIGIVADQANDAGFGDLVIRGADGEIEGFQYERLTAVLLNELQALRKRVAALEAA